MKKQHSQLYCIIGVDVPYMGKFWSGKKSANLANRRPFAKFLSANVSF